MSNYVDKRHLMTRVETAVCLLSSEDTECFCPTFSSMAEAEAFHRWSGPTGGIELCLAELAPTLSASDTPHSMMR